MKQLIFVSSVQKELADERRAIRDFVRGDPMLGQHFEVFLFEDQPASSQSPQQIFIQEVDRCDVYIGILGNEYGWSDGEGISPTERELDRAIEKRKNRLVFVKGADDSRRQEKMNALIQKAGQQLTRRRFTSASDLTSQVYHSLIKHLEQRGIISHRPFDASLCEGTTLAHIDDAKVKWFADRARAERQLALGSSLGTRDALIRVNLLDQDIPTNAAVLLFGRNPQEFFPAAEVKCVHLHGTQVSKPMPSYQLFKGTLFDQSDKAVEFVMSILGRAVGTRQSTTAAPVQYEIPREVVAEAIINAVAHRDYTSAAAIQVYVFADRIEVWNPGELPPSLTPESLRQQHPSLPRNPMIAEPLFQAHYIEKVGSGTLDMITGCQAADLPEPEFFQQGDQFVLRIWRDWLTTEVIARLNLNKRQTAAIGLIQRQRRISAGEYQRLTGASRATAKRDLEDLASKSLVVLVGSGRGAFYEVAKKRLINGSNGSSGPGVENGSQTAQSAQRMPAKKSSKATTNAPIASSSASSTSSSSSPSRRKTNRGANAPIAPRRRKPGKPKPARLGNPARKTKR